MASSSSTGSGPIPDSVLIFDVGANIGNKAAHFATRGARVVCFEPVPECVTALQERFADNPSVLVVPCALGAAADTLPMSISSTATTISTFSNAWKHGRFKDETWDKTLQVPVRPLDSAIAEYGLPDYCKIDVEGFELSVLQGLSQPIPVLSFEFCSEGLAQTSACLEHLEELGYHRFNIAYGESTVMRHERWLDAIELTAELREHPSPLAWGDVYAAHDKTPARALASLLPSAPKNNDLPTAGADTLSQLLWRGLSYPGVPLRLHLGCGETLLPGYVNIDYSREQHNVMTVKPDMAADITSVDFPERTVDEVRLHHVFEHFNRVVALGLLIRWQRWLKPGGRLVIETPDFEHEVRAFLGYRDDPGPLAKFSFRHPRPFFRSGMRKFFHLLRPRRQARRSFSDRMSAIRSLEGDQSAAWAYHVGHWFAERFEQTLSQLGFENIAIQHSLSGHVPPLHNITMTATRGEDRPEEQQLRAAYALLWNSTVIESERPTWQVWCEQLRQFLDSNESSSPLPRHDPVPKSRHVDYG
jgi:FkbM family methyltransferase